MEREKEDVHSPGGKKDSGDAFTQRTPRRGGSWLRFFFLEGKEKKRGREGRGLTARGGGGKHRVQFDVGRGRGGNRIERGLERPTKRGGVRVPQRWRKTVTKLRQKERKVGVSASHGEVWSWREKGVPHIALKKKKKKKRTPKFQGWGKPQENPCPSSHRKTRARGF